MKQKFVVEGHYHDPEDGNTTGDWILALDKEKAAEAVTKARRHLANGWTLDRVSTFEEYIADLEYQIGVLKSASPQEVTRSWNETKASLMGW